MRSQMLLIAALASVAIMLPVGCSREAAPEDVAQLSPGATSRDGAAAREKAALNPGSGITSPSRPRANSITLPAGTPLVVRTTSVMSTKSQQSGQSFTAHLEQPMLLNGTEVLPKGALMEGIIVESDDGGRVKGLAVLAVKMSRLQSPGGQMVELSTNSVIVEARSTKKNDAIKVGIGSGVGAAIGAIAGGGKGAAIGAAAGAGAGTGVVLATHGDSAVIPSESVLRFTLSSPITLPG